jgi:WD40 repeat protein
MLENLPLGLLPFEIEEIFDNDLNFDNYGNVDYTVILNNELFASLERSRLRREQLLRKMETAETSGAGGQSDLDKLTDHRKVVVEDLMYIDDLEVIIYTTIFPKTSTIFVTHTKKAAQPTKEVEVLTL